MLWGERRGQWHHRRSSESMERPMPQLNDLSRSLITLEQDATLLAVIEMGQSSWLVAGIVPGVERQPLKKLGVDEGALLKLLHRWRTRARGKWESEGSAGAAERGERKGGDQHGDR